MVLIMQFIFAGRVTQGVPISFRGSDEGVTRNLLNKTGKFLVVRFSLPTK
jgi:hypothetical protein